MKFPQPRMVSARMLGRSAHYCFCGIWIALAGVFLWLALEALGSMNIGLPRSGFSIPARPNVQIGNLRFAEVVNHLAEKYDDTAIQLEQSIHRSAKTSFSVNLAAAFLSLVAFVAQLSGGSHAEAKWQSPCDPKNPFRAWGFRPTSREEPVTKVVEAGPAMHNGSFPDGGYGR